MLREGIAKKGRRFAAGVRVSFVRSCHHVCQQAGKRNCIRQVVMRRCWSGCGPRRRRALICLRQNLDH